MMPKKPTKGAKVKVYVKGRWLDGIIKNTEANAARAADDKHMVKLAAGGVHYVQLRGPGRWDRVRRAEEADHHDRIVQGILASGLRF